MTEPAIDHAGLEALPFAECLRLLGSVPVGRMVFAAAGETVVLPVNHALDGQDVVFHTTYGSKLAAAERQETVSFEADAYDEATRSGWSVLVTGRAEAVLDPAEERRLARLGLHPWAGGVDRPYWIRIRPTAVSGRRIAV